MRRPFLHVFAVLGPGFAVAATGVGAGDVVAAAVSGAQYGTAILWAAVVGAVVKYVLNEGIARWQLSTGTTLLDAWSRHIHRLFVAGFAVYLVVWTFVVAGALMAACGLAAHAMIPGVPVAAAGAVHALAALAFVWTGRYALFERLMKAFVGLMFVTVLASAVLVRPDVGALLGGLVVPAVPPGAGKFLLGVVGGVGGSVTLLSYGYWIRERGWTSPADRPAARLDLAAAYTLTGLFAVAIVVVAAGVDADVVTGNGMALHLAERIGAAAGPVGRWVFLVGFWGAVFTSMLGVWQGVPYLFADFVRTLRRPAGAAPAEVPVDVRAPAYRGYLLFIALPPMLLLLVDRPVWVVLVYSIAGAFFMPLLAGTLLYLNNRRRWVGEAKNGWAMNLLLVAALVLFGYLCASELLSLFGAGI